MNEIDGPASDRWLRVFAAASQSDSFTAAATTLGIGQSAVSHAISKLEHELDTVLFERSPRGISLTEPAAELADSVRAGYALIDGALDRARRSSDTANAALTISVSTSLATYWLMPRLANFKLSNPSIELRCVTNDTDRGIGTDGADLWVPLGRGPWPQQVTADFCAEELYPVASPGLLAAAGLSPAELAEEPQKLTTLPMLHLEERYASRFDWPSWFEHVDVVAAKRPPAVASNDYSLILQAALDGQGVALGWHHIVRELVDSGALIKLSATSVTTDNPFVILSNDEPAKGSNADLFRQWLIGEAAV